MTRRAAHAMLISLALSTGCMRLGLIDGHPFVHRAKLSDARIGRSQGFPIVVRIPVGPKAKGNTGQIGKLAYQALFVDAGYAPFVFNVTFSSASVDDDGKSGYADPRSIWFNVFFGAYQIDAPQKSWGRPFGYRMTDKGPEVDFEDIARIGKADWNYFSNHIYGVPLEAVRPHDALDMSALRTEHHGRERIGNRFWDVVEIWNLSVVSAYRAKGDPRTLQTTFPELTSLWQSSFGTTEPGDAFPTSFVPMKIHAKILMAFELNRETQTHETYLFGATVHQGYADEAENERFLALQMAALKSIIASHHPDRGFVEPGSRAAPSRPEVQRPPG